MKAAGRVVLCALFFNAACAPSLHPPQPGTGTLWGHVSLVPKKGYTPSKGGGGAYGSRETRGVKLVDYDHPGFGVVFAEGVASRTLESLELTLQSSRLRSWFEPEQAVVPLNGKIVVINHSGGEQLLSCRACGLVRRLKPRQRVEIKAARAGPLQFFLVQKERLAEATVFVAPGAYALIGYDGRWILSDLPPGKKTLHVWLPRFPGDSREVAIKAGGIQRIDFEVGVDKLTNLEEGRTDEIQSSRIQ